MKKINYFIFLRCIDMCIADKVSTVIRGTIGSNFNANYKDTIVSELKED
jgi:hypothetical protein